MRAALPQAGVYDLYGLTETGSCDFCLRRRPADGAGTIGRPTEQSRSGCSGRMAGRDPAAPRASSRSRRRSACWAISTIPASAAASFSDGYLRSGDLARVRPDGRVEIVGRLKDIVARAGNKIAPAKIHALLSSHPDVAAALCAGVPDQRLGEAIHAVVVPKANAPDPDALRRWAAERIERYKVPDAIYVRDTLPLGDTGKVRRAGVADIARAVMTTAGPKS